MDSMYRFRWESLRRFGIRRAARLVSTGLLAACGAATAAISAAQAPVAFQEVTAAAGFGYAGASWTVAWGDANGDALPDLYFTNHGGLHNLFLNRGAGTFAEAPTTMFDPAKVDSHGAAWADFDNDGDQDLIELVGADRGSSAGKSNRLFVNEGGRLTDRAVERGLQDPLGRGRTPLWFDWDRDGFLDVLVLNADRADAPSILFRNNHGFFSRTNAVDIRDFTKFAVLGSLAPGARHVLVSGQPFPGHAYDAHQLSPLPMTDLREALGITPMIDMVADTVLLDVNGDGVDEILEVKGRLTSDALIADGTLRSRIVLEDTGGTRGFRFRASAPITVRIAPLWESWWSARDVYIGRNGWHPGSVPFQLSVSNPAVDGMAAALATKGIYIGYDRAAGKWDVRIVSSLRQEANFTINGGNLSALERVGFLPFARLPPTLLANRYGLYTDVSSEAGLANPAAASHCFSATAADFDNDGDLDVFSACSGPIGGQGIGNQLLRNNGAGWFSVVPGAAGVSRQTIGVADGVAAADYDLDGFVDLALTNGQGLYPFSNGPTQLFRNVSQRSGNRNHWLQIDLRGVESNRDGVGARVRLSAGGKTQTRMQRNGIHNGSQDFSRIHFGLGANTTVAFIDVEWPSGTRQTLTNVAADQVIRIVEGRGATAPYRLTPYVEDYGAQTVHTGATRHFTITNTSTFTLPLLKVQMIGANPGQFIATHGCGTPVAASGSCAVNIAFRPTVAGWKSAQLLVVAGDKFIKTAKVSGNAVQAQFTLSPTSMAFGNLRVGTASVAKLVTVRNTGASILPVRWVGFEGVNPTQFAASSGCPEYVAVGQSCTIRAVFKPTSNGSKSAQLVVSPGKSGTRKTVGLVGNGV